MGFFDIFKSNKNVSGNTQGVVSSNTSSTNNEVRNNTMITNSHTLVSPQTTTNTSGGAPKRFVTYKNRTYVVKVGKRGGKYITVKGEKVYV
jgi:hypothetical protein